MVCIKDTLVLGSLRLSPGLLFRQYKASTDTNGSSFLMQEILLFIKYLISVLKLWLCDSRYIVRIPHML